MIRSSIIKFLIGFGISFLLVISYRLLGLDQIRYIFVLLLVLPLIIITVFELRKKRELLSEEDRRSVERDDRAVPVVARRMPNSGKIYPEMTENSEVANKTATRELKKPNYVPVVPTRRFKLAMAIFLGIASLSLAGYFIHDIVNNASGKSIKAWQSSTFFICLGSAWIYYIYNTYQFRTMADKITFFTGFGLGPPTAIGFIIS